jgi:hypothetical protein
MADSATATVDATHAPAPPADSRRADLAIIAGLALLTFVLHLAFYKGFGFFRDELYFIACSHHLDWGYVDQPPGVAIVAWASRHLLGDSLFAVRFVPCVFAALQVFFAGLTARALGGGRFAQVFTCLCVLAAPIYFGSYLNTDMFMTLGWAACAWVAARVLAGESPRLWLLFGLFGGLALQGKHAMAFFGVAFLLGLLASPQRKMLASPWIWAGAVVAFLLALPNLIWEYRHQWATYELLSNIARSDKNLVLGPGQYLVSNILFLSPLTFFVWFGGVLWCLLSKDGLRFRALGWTWVISYLLFVLLHGKDYYLAPLYPMLFAAGAVGLEAWFAHSPIGSQRTWLKPVFAILILLGGIVLWPFAMPMMSVEKFIAYEKLLGAAPKKTENAELSQLPQQYADMFGWPEMAKEVARVYNTLPPQDRGKCGIAVRNYGEAGAIDYFGRQYGLPPAITGHQNYFFWGPRGYTGECLLILGRTKQELEQNYDSLTLAGETYHPYAMPYENHRQIWICRKPKYGTLQQVWYRTKAWI